MNLLIPYCLRSHSSVSSYISYFTNSLELMIIMIAFGTQPSEINVYVENIANPFKTALICTWQTTDGSEWSLPYISFQPTCSNLLSILNDDFSFNGYFILPFEQVFLEGGYKIVVEVNHTISFTNGYLFAHPVTNFVTLSKRISGILLPYFAVFANSRFVFAQNQLFTVDTPCPSVDSEFGMDIMRLDLNTGELYMNCFAGFYSYTNQRSYAFEYPEVITIGPINGIISSITLMNFDNSTIDLNSMLIPLCPHFSSPTTSPSPSRTPDPSLSRIISVSPISITASSSRFQIFSTQSESPSPSLFIPNTLLTKSVIPSPTPSFSSNLPLISAVAASAIIVPPIPDLILSLTPSPSSNFFPTPIPQR